jgi:hypothetical protein
MVLPLAYPDSHPHDTSPPLCFELWYHRLGHPGHHTMKHLHHQQQIPTHKPPSSLCHACQLGCHVRLPFYSSDSFSVKPFQLLHCDLWMSPTPSTSGFCYYLIIVDDYTHYFGVFPFTKNPMCMLPSQPSTPTLVLNLTYPFLLYNVTMAMSL